MSPRWSQQRPTSASWSLLCRIPRVTKKRKTYLLRRMPARLTALPVLCALFFVLFFRRSWSSICPPSRIFAEGEGGLGAETWGRGGTTATTAVTTATVSVITITTTLSGILRLRRTVSVCRCSGWTWATGGRWRWDRETLRWGALRGGMEWVINGFMVEWVMDWFVVDGSSRNELFMMEWMFRDLRDFFICVVHDGMYYSWWNEWLVRGGMHLSVMKWVIRDGMGNPWWNGLITEWDPHDRLNVLWFNTLLIWRMVHDIRYYPWWYNRWSNMDGSWWNGWPVLGWIIDDGIDNPSWNG